MKTMTNDEALAIFKKYDPDLYDYYMKAAWYLGYSARNWAEYLLKHQEARPIEKKGA